VKQCFQLVILLLAATPGCSAPEPWRGCTLALHTGYLPGLQRAAENTQPKLLAAPHCSPLPGPGLPDEPEAVDDLDSLLGRGRVCGPSGQLSSSRPCGPLPIHDWHVTAGPTPNNSPPYCGAATAECPNQTLVIAREGVDPLQLEFYDDPSSHRSAELTNCAGGRDLSPCYYRLGHITVAVRL
jgi:hypothetical protein